MKVVEQNRDYSKIDCMEKMLHLAVQYLATVTNSLGAENNKNSYLSLKFCHQTRCIRTLPLNENGDTLSLKYDDFSLLWYSDSQLSQEKLYLDGTTHIQIINWISKIAKEIGFEKPYKYTFDTNLPYSEIDDFFAFKLLSKHELNKLLSYRLLIQNTLDTIVDKHQLNAEVKIWPLDFSTSVYALLDSVNDMTIGLGMRIIDPLDSNPDHQLYTIGWHGKQNIKTVDFHEIQYGQWNKSSWEGAVMPLNSYTNDAVMTFFDETVKAYTHKYYKEVI